MKKLVLLAAVVFSVSLLSCTGNGEGNATTDSLVATVDSAATATVDTAAAVVDSAAATVDSLAAQAK